MNKRNESMRNLNKYESAIVRNADWFISKETREGFIDVDGDEFYGVRGDATLIGHSVTVRMYAYVLTQDVRYLDSARKSLTWLAWRQDNEGGWKKHAAFTLDGAQCVFEGFNTYQTITGDRQFETILTKAAGRMIRGTLTVDGGLRLPNVIEIGEYAHFALLAWKTTNESDFQKAADLIVGHITDNFDDFEGFWLPFDKHHLRFSLPVALARPILRWFTYHIPLRGRIVARLAGHLLRWLVGASRPQYSMSMMDAEALLDTHDRSCHFPQLREQTERAIRWVTTHCAGPFPGSLVESTPSARRDWVYPIPIINNHELAALWPTTCLLIAYCGLNEIQYAAAATEVADWILTAQRGDGGFSNFQQSDGTVLPLQSGNVNFYASMALWLYNKTYGGALPQRQQSGKEAVSTTTS